MHTKYDARAPTVCRSRLQPTQGPPSREQARRYFLCDSEMELSGSLWLNEDVEIEIGRERPYNPGADRYRDDIDPAEPVYPIRGSYTVYSCKAIFYGESETARGNCQVMPTPNATGVCYKDSFGDWHCRMGPPNRREPEPLPGLRPFPR
jgi:hypothetical protein